MAQEVGRQDDESGIHLEVFNEAMALAVSFA